MHIDLRYIIDHWHQYDRWIKNNVKDIEAIKLWLDTVEIPEPGEPPFFIKGVATDYNDLLASYPSPNQFDFVYVENSQGTWWTPGSMLGTYYGAGLYYYTGVEWKQDKDEIHKSLQDIFDILATVSAPVTKPISVNTTALINDVLLVDASLGDITVTLPTIVGNENGTVTVTKTDDSANFVVVEGDGVETIIGETSLEISNPYDSITLIADATQWTLK